jgi:hypothetical protein
LTNLSLKKYEMEVVAMAGKMLHGDENVRGTMTSGCFSQNTDS